MGVGGKLLRAPELERAWGKALALEGLALERGNLAREEARRLRRERALEAARREGVDLRPRDLVLPRQVLRGVAHGRVGRWIEQRFPQEVLEIDRAHAETAHG